MNPTVKKCETRITIDETVWRKPDTVSPNKPIVCRTLGFVGITFQMYKISGVIEIVRVFGREGVSPLLDLLLQAAGMFSIRVTLDPLFRESIYSITWLSTPLKGLPEEEAISERGPTGGRGINIPSGYSAKRHHHPSMSVQE